VSMGRTAEGCPRGCPAACQEIVLLGLP
jgi:hypothetical protein